MLRMVSAGDWLLEFGRVMVPLPWMIAHYISPESFIGVQLLMILFFWAKAFSVYLILTLLRVTNKSNALFIGILFMIYPADTGLLALRAFSHHSGVFFFLLSLLFLVLSCKFSSKLYLIPLVITHFVSSFTSEAGSILAFFAPLMILLFPRCPRSKKVAILAMWYFVLIFSLVNYAYYWIAGGEYQSSRFERGLSGSVASFLVDVLLGNLKAIWFSFIVSWGNAIESLLAAWRYLPYAIAMTLVAAGGIWWHNFVSDDEEDVIFKARNVYVYGFLAGVLIFLMGFFPFSITDIRDETWRVFYYSALGPAFFWGSVIYLSNRIIGKRWPYFSPLVTTAFVFLISVHALDQHSSFYNASLKQQRIIESVIEEAPYLKPDTVIVLMEDRAAVRAFPNERVLSAALIWAYSNENITARVCFINSGNCQFEKIGLRYFSANPTLNYLNKVYPYEKLLIFRETDDGRAELVSNLDSSGVSVSNYNPYNRIVAYLPFPEFPKKAFYAGVGPDPKRLSPENWTGVGLTLNDRMVCDIAEDQHCSLHLQGSLSAPSIFSQSIELNGRAGQALKLGFWARAELIVIDSSWPQVELTLVNEDGTVSQQSLYLKGLTADWCAYEMEIDAAKPFRSIVLNLESGNGSWSIWMDALQLSVDDIPLQILNPSFEN